VGRARYELMSPVGSGRPLHQQGGLRSDASAWSSWLILGSPEIPELVRWIYPEETGITLVPRLNDKGFAVTPNASSTGFSGNVGGAQDQAFALAEWQCSAMYSIDSRITLPVTLAQWGVAYDYYAEFQLPCQPTSPRPDPILMLWSTSVVLAFAGPLEVITSIWLKSENAARPFRAA